MGQPLVVLCPGPVHARGRARSDVRQGRDRANSVRQGKRPTRRDRRPAGREDRRQRIGLRLRSRQRLQRDRARALQAERFARFHLRNRGEGDDRARARLSRRAPGSPEREDRRRGRRRHGAAGARPLPANGRLDATFGDHGFATISGPLVASTPPAVFAQKNGAILLDLPGATGGTEAMDALVRFTSSGRVDPSFGTAGVALLPSSGSTSLERGGGWKGARRRRNRRVDARAGARRQQLCRPGPSRQDRLECTRRAPDVVLRHRQHLQAVTRTRSHAAV